MNTTLHARAIRLGARILATYLITLSITAPPLFGQSNPCAEPFKYLREGIYNRYKEGTSLQKYSSMKDYLKSEDFKQEVKKGGWSGGLTVPIKGSPLSLNANSSSDNFKEFKSGIEKLSENQLIEAFGQQIEKSEPNTDFAKLYFKCLAENAQGFTWTSERIGKRAFITIRFMPLSMTDPMPVITDDVKVDNASDILAPKKGQHVDLSNVISAVVKNLDQPVTVTMVTDKKTVYASSEPALTPTPTPTAAPTAPPPAKSLSQQILDGAEFKVDMSRLRKPIGTTLRPGTVLHGLYRQKDYAWEVWGDHPTKPGLHFMAGFPGGNGVKNTGTKVTPADNQLYLWGHKFRFDEQGKVYHSSQDEAIGNLTVTQ